jgi:hypothetical protein
MSRAEGNEGKGPKINGGEAGERESVILRKFSRRLIADRRDRVGLDGLLAMLLATWRRRREVLLIGKSHGRRLAARSGATTIIFAPAINAVLKVNIDDARGVLLFEKDRVEKAESHSRRRAAWKSARIVIGNVAGE